MGPFSYSQQNDSTVNFTVFPFDSGKTKKFFIWKYKKKQHKKKNTTTTDIAYSLHSSFEPLHFCSHTFYGSVQTLYDGRQQNAKPSMQLWNEQRKPTFWCDFNFNVNSTRQPALSEREMCVCQSFWNSGTKENVMRYISNWIKLDFHTWYSIKCHWSKVHPNNIYAQCVRMFNCIQIYEV